MFKRVILFAAMNIAMIASISIIMNLFGLQPYMTAYGINYESLMIFCLLWGMLGSFFSLMISKWMAKKFMGVQIIDNDPQYAALVNKVHQMAKAANLPKMPEIGIYNSPDVNAFATGPSKSNSLVAVSTGLLRNMESDEVEGVLGHEIAHVANGDMVTMALVQGVVNAFVMFFARIAAFALSNAMRSDNDNRSHGGGIVHMLTVFAFEIVFGFIGMFIIAWFSRNREFRADRGGAQLAGKSAMINALKRLQLQHAGGEPDEVSHQSFDTMKISNKKKVLSLLSTHPKLEDRIAALERAQIA